MRVEKKKNRKSIRMISVMLLMIAMMCTLLSGCKEEGYRLIQVYEVSGQATIEREKVGSMDAYENLNLVSGDWVNVLKESFLRLKMDEDKYMFVEEESALSIVATSEDKNSRTDIQLEKGAITVEVQNKLKDGDSFEVTTPNAVMAVRGTVFYISADEDENGEPITRIVVLEGSVTLQKLDEDGNASEEQSVSSGKEAIVYKETDGVIIEILDGIDTDTIPLEAWKFLRDVSEGGRELTLTLEEIIEIIEGTETEAETETEQETETTTDTEIVTETETEKDSEKDIEKQETTEAVESTETPGNTGGNTRKKA